MPKEPIRSCAICRTKKEKKELFRFVIFSEKHSNILKNVGMFFGGKDGEVFFDKEQKIDSRGFYICGKECWEKARAKKRKVKYNSVAKPAKMVGLPDKGFEEIALL